MAYLDAILTWGLRGLKLKKMTLPVDCLVTHIQIKQWKIAVKRKGSSYLSRRILHFANSARLFSLILFFVYIGHTQFIWPRGTVFLEWYSSVWNCCLLDDIACFNSWKRYCFHWILERKNSIIAQKSTHEYQITVKDVKLICHVIKTTWKNISEFKP